MTNKTTSLSSNYLDQKGEVDMITFLIWFPIIAIISVFYLLHRKKRIRERYLEELDMVCYENIKIVDVVVDELKNNKRAENKVRDLLDAARNNKWE